MKYLVSLRSIGELALENLVYLKAVRLTESLALTQTARDSVQSVLVCYNYTNKPLLVLMYHFWSMCYMEIILFCCLTCSLSNLEDQIGIPYLLFMHKNPIVLFSIYVSNL